LSFQGRLEAALRDRFRAVAHERAAFEQRNRCPVVADRQAIAVRGDESRPGTWEYVPRPPPLAVRGTRRPRSPGRGRWIRGRSVLYLAEGDEDMNRRLRVLIVYDEKSMQEYIGSELPRLLHEVTVCADGRAASLAPLSGSSK